MYYRVGQKWTVFKSLIVAPACFDVEKPSVYQFFFWCKAVLHVIRGI